MALVRGKGVAVAPPIPGVYWMPVLELLEAHELEVCSSQWGKQESAGRKSDLQE